MLREKINRLKNEYGVKQEAIIEQLGTNRNTFGKKMKDNSFDQRDRDMLLLKWGKLL